MLIPFFYPDFQENIYFVLINEKPMVNQENMVLR